MKAKKKRKTKLTRLFSFLLTLVMVVGMLPATSLTALAEGTTGSGTEEDPYIVTDYEELRNLMLNAPYYQTTYIKVGSSIEYNKDINDMELCLFSPYQSVVLDLNDHAITRSGTTIDHAVVDLDIGNLTIRDSSRVASGKIVNEMSGETWDRAAIYVRDNGNLTIEKGVFFAGGGEGEISAIHTFGGSTQIKGGSFHNKQTNGRAAYFEGGNVAVYDGRFRVWDTYNGSICDYGMYIDNNADVMLYNCMVIGGGKEVIHLGDTKIPNGCSMTEGKEVGMMGGYVPAVYIAPKDGCSIDTLSATVTKPLHGAFPETSVTAGGTNYTVKVDRWYDSDSAAFPDYSTIMKTGDTFVGGKPYVVQVTFTPNDGYIFSGNRTVTINGVPAYFCGLESSGVDFVYRAALTAPADIAKVAMTSDLTTPIIEGKVTHPAFTVTKGKPVYVSDGKWQIYHDDYDRWYDYSGTTFEEGKYRYAVQLSLKDKDCANNLMSNDVTVTVDGKKWTVGEKTRWETTNKVTSCMVYSQEYTAIRQYTINVTDGKAKVDGKVRSKATAGTKVTLIANAAPSGKVFDKWKVVSGNITLEDANSKTTTFTMPARAVSIKATYKSSSPIPAEEGKIITDKQGNRYKVTKSDAKNGEVAYAKQKSSIKGTVKIPDAVTIDGITYKVTAIVANALMNNKNITNVIIGNNVTVIGKNAFAGCNNLGSVTVGKKVKTISAGAFSECAKLKTVKLGAAATTIGDKAFYKCTSLTSITIPTRVTKIGKSAFEGCKNLKTINVKSTMLKSVGSRALKGIHAKATINVPKSKLTKYKSLFKNKGQGKNVKIVGAF